MVMRYLNAVISRVNTVVVTYYFLRVFEEFMRKFAALFLLLIPFVPAVAQQTIPLPRLKLPLASSRVQTASWQIGKN